MLRASQNYPCGCGGRGGYDGAEDAGYPPCSSPAVFERFARGHYLLGRGVARVIAASTAFSSAAQEAHGSAAPEVFAEQRAPEVMARTTSTDAATA